MKIFISIFLLLILFHSLVYSIDIVYTNPSSNSFDSSKIKEIKEGVKPVPSKSNPHLYMGLGDLNLNGLNNELDDAMLFIEYFLNGICVFSHIEAQKASTDANYDEVQSHISDLIYILNRVAKIPLPYRYNSKIVDTAKIIIEQDIIRLSGIDIGGLYITTKGNPTSKFDKLEMEVKFQYYPEADITKLLVYSLDGKFLKDGELFGLDVNDILELQVSTKDGRRVYIKGYSKEKGSPDEVSSIIILRNQFGYSSAIAFHHLKSQKLLLEIYNVLGNKIFESDKFYSAGKVEINWEGVDNNGDPVSSGVYFYKLTTGDITKTEKLILVK